MVAFVATAALGLGAWSAPAGALLEEPIVTVSSDEHDVDPDAVRYIAERIVKNTSVRVVVSPDGSVSAPSITGGVVAPPPPPPIVRDLLRRVARTFGVEGEVEVVISAGGADVSAPSITGGVVAPPPPPPIVKELLRQVKETIGRDAVVSIDAPTRYAAYSSAEAL